LADGVASHGFAGAADEDPFVAGPEVEVLGEYREDVGRESDAAFAGFRLGVLVVGDLALQQLGAAAAYADCARSEVDVLTVKSDDFAAAEAAPCREEDGSALPRSDGVDQGDDLRPGVAVGRSLAWSAPAPEGAGIAEDGAFPDRRVHHGAEESIGLRD
jgi:hypothetical protein